MNVLVCPSRDEMGKFHSLVLAYPFVWEGSLLDVGCRSTNLKHALPDGSDRYCGLDVSPPAEILGDVEAGLPFQNESFDSVVALDVLEHTDDIYKAFAELCRVAKKYILICLPNAYEIKARIKYLLGCRLSGKYGLPVEPPPDRHRWLFSLDEARLFVERLGSRKGFELMAEASLIGPRRASAVGRYLAGPFPNLLSPWYVALLHRRDGRGT